LKNLFTNKAMLFESTHVSSAIASTQTFTFTFK